MIELMQDSLNYELLALAKRLATEATSLARSPSERVEIRRKPDTSVVTDVDYAIQARILEAIAETYPDHAVRAEESVLDPTAHAQPGSARYCWVVDPLDGTRNYASGFPFFATSIAVLDQGRPVVGVVHEHNLGFCYAAVLGQGATLNDRPIHVHEPPADDDWLVAIPSSKDSFTVEVINAWVSTRGFVCRNVGSAAVHLAMVASGALTGAFAKQCKLWDIAAGLLLITEAGGRITDPDGDELLPFRLDGDPEADVPFLAATPDSHRHLLTTIPTARKQGPRD